MAPESVKTAVRAIADGLVALGIPAEAETVTPGLEQVLVPLETGERMEILQLPKVASPSILQFYVPLCTAPAGADRAALRRFLAVLNLRLPLPSVELLEPSGALHLRYMLACLDQAIDVERVVLTSTMLAWQVALFGPVVRTAAAQGEAAGLAALTEALAKATAPD